MKKNVKVFEIKAIAANGNDRTVQAIAPLNMTLTEVCKMKNIPMLSIVSTKVTAPMTMDEAINYTFQGFTSIVFAPSTRLVKSTLSVIAA